MPLFFSSRAYYSSNNYQLIYRNYGSSDWESPSPFRFAISSLLRYKRPIEPLKLQRIQWEKYAQNLFHLLSLCAATQHIHTSYIFYTIKSGHFSKCRRRVVRRWLHICILTHAKVISRVGKQTFAYSRMRVRGWMMFQGCGQKKFNVLLHLLYALLRLPRALCVNGRMYV